MGELCDTPRGPSQRSGAAVTRGDPDCGLLQQPGDRTQAPRAERGPHAFIPSMRQVAVIAKKPRMLQQENIAYT